MNKAGLQYIQLVYFYRLLLVRYLVLFNLVSLLAENLPEDEPSLGENANMGEPPLEPADCFEKGRIGQQVTGKELDEETGLMYFGARYYDPKISNWISTDPALGEYIPTGKQVYFPEKAFNASKLKGSGGIYNSVNINLYHYAAQNPIKYLDPTGNDNVTFVKNDVTEVYSGKAITFTYDPAAKTLKATGTTNLWAKGGNDDNGNYVEKEILPADGIAISVISQNADGDYFLLTIDTLQEKARDTHDGWGARRIAGTKQKINLSNDGSKILSLGESEKFEDFIGKEGDNPLTNPTTNIVGGVEPSGNTKDHSHDAVEQAIIDSGL